jgi:hypothetical protein
MRTQCGGVYGCCYWCRCSVRRALFVTISQAEGNSPGGRLECCHSTGDVLSRYNAHEGAVLHCRVHACTSAEVWVMVLVRPLPLAQSLCIILRCVCSAVSQCPSHAACSLQLGRQMCLSCIKSLAARVLYACCYVHVCVCNASTLQHSGLYGCGPGRRTNRCDVACMYIHQLVSQPILDPAHLMSRQRLPFIL